jgi:hypothetical protein
MGSSNDADDGRWIDLGALGITQSLCDVLSACTIGQSVSDTD